MEARRISTERATLLLVDAAKAGLVNPDNSFSQELRAKLSALGATGLAELRPDKADELSRSFGVSDGPAQEPSAPGGAR